MFSVFMWKVIILVIAGFAGAINMLYKIISEQKEIDSKYKDIDESEKKDMRKVKKYVPEKINENNFDSLLAEAKHNSYDLEELKKAIQDNLRNYIKNGDRDKARACNEQLRKIDLALKEGN